MGNRNILVGTITKCMLGINCSVVKEEGRGLNQNVPGSQADMSFNFVPKSSKGDILFYFCTFSLKIPIICEVSGCDPSSSTVRIHSL